jgi:hypothetical protein
MGEDRGGFSAKSTQSETIQNSQRAKHGTDCDGGTITGAAMSQHGASVLKKQVLLHVSHTFTWHMTT